MSRLTRRRFLEDSMFAAAAATVAGNALAASADEVPSKSPNEKIGIACVGVRGQGNSHLEAYSTRPDTEVLYICDVDEEVGRKRAKETAERQGREPKVVKDVRQLLEDKSVDAITTATPNHWHALVSIWAMQAGKDVYVEKPVSHNVSEGRRMVEAARKYGRICQTGTQARSQVATIKGMQYVHDGKIGEVKLARGLCYKSRKSIGPKGVYPVPDGVDYNLWLGPAPERPVERAQFHYDWHWFWDYGSGDLGNQGIHQMDLARWGLGVARLPDRVFSYGGRFGYEDAGETANTQVVVHDYGDKTLVFEVRGLPTKPKKPLGSGVGIIVEGTEGVLAIGGYGLATVFDLEGKKIAEFKGGSSHHANFLKAVRSRNYKDLNGDILEGHLSSALCHLGNISYRLGTPTSVKDAASRLGANDEASNTFDRFQSHLKENGIALDKIEVRYGRELKVDPAAEKFVDDSEADRMLTRDYRAPFIVPPAGKV